MRNGNTCKWEISSFGKPSSKLPEGATASSIATRLTNHKVSRGSGTWSGKEWPCVLAALDKLSETEMEKVAGLVIQRTTSGSDPEAGGNYSQEKHVIQLFDNGMRDPEAMALGTAPASMLPGPVHFVLHEVGHAIAYAPLRGAMSKLDAAKATVKSKGKALEDKWGSSAFSFDETSYGYKSSENGVSAEQREQYRGELKDFQKSHGEMLALDKKVPKASGVVKQFRGLVKSKKMAAVTPYCKRKMEEAGRGDDLDAVEEFFAESFAIWKWYPGWLEEHRKPVHGFFAANKHLG